VVLTGAFRGVGRDRLLPRQRDDLGRDRQARRPDRTGPPRRADRAVPAGWPRRAGLVAHGRDRGARWRPLPA